MRRINKEWLHARCCLFDNSATNSPNGIVMRSMLCLSRKRPSLRVGSSGRIAQCFSDERLIIWRANSRSNCVENLQPRKRKLFPFRISCTDSGIGVCISISVNTSTKSESETKIIACRPNGAERLIEQRVPFSMTLVGLQLLRVRRPTM